MDDFDPVTFVMNNHRLTAYRLCAEAYARGLAAGERKGMRKAAEIAKYAERWIGDWEKKYGNLSVAEAIEKEANK